MSITFDSVEQPAVTSLKGRIGWLCQSIRWLAVLWLVWILYYTVWVFVWMVPPAIAGTWNAYWQLPAGSISIADVYMNRGFAMLSWVTSAALVYAVWKLMSGYLAGDILTASAAQRLRSVGLWGLAAVLIDIIIRPLMLGFMSWDILGKMTFFDWFTTHDLFYAVIALFILALGHIQGTAAKINEEHRQFV